MRSPPAHETAARLRPHAAELATHLLGPPNGKLSTRHELRWGNKGGLSLRLDKCRWRDFTTDKKGDLLDLIAEQRSIPLREAIAWAREWLGLPASPVQIYTNDSRRPRIIATSSPQPELAPLDDDEARKRALALRLWENGRPIAGTLAEQYLIGRGIAPAAIVYAAAALRCDPACYYADGVTHPAMIALVTDAMTNEPIAVHRTFLKADGTGRLDKKLLGPSRNGVIRLSPDDSVTNGIAICEGIETSLSIISIGITPVWSCISAGGISTFPVLAGIEALTIFADADEAGQKAAQACANRWSAGREVTIRSPKRNKSDWLDLVSGRCA